MIRAPVVRLLREKFQSVKLVSGSIFSGIGPEVSLY
jgi:hypothetical protein